MTLDEQCRHQVRIMRERMPWWISSIFAAGLVFSSIGLFASIAGKDVPFSLVLRLWEKDSMQVVCTRETRQGSFW